MIIYNILHVFFWLLFSIFFRAEAIGRENMPKDGGVILAANHMSNFDPPLLATYLRRPVSYMAKKELFEVPVLKQIITACFSFPVRRGAADRGAIKAALNELKKGRCVGLFPEGTRSRDGKTHKAEAGVALIAAMAKVPVVPAAIIGTNRIFANGSLLPKLKIIYGEPMYFTGKHNNKEELDEFSKKIMEEIKKMINLHSNNG